jgi:5-methylcytosine-specific restriction endonuclease McrA
MDLRKLSDENLLATTKLYVANERRALTSVLHHLREINDRRLFSKLKFPSLYEYAIKELKYTEGEALARIRAMKMLAVFPEIESKIAAGTLSLTNISVVDRAYRRSGKELDRRDLLAKVENKSVREAKKITGLDGLPELKLSMISDDELRRKMLAVMGKYAHLQLSLEDLLHMLLDAELENDACEKCGSTYALEWDHIVPKAKGGSDDPSNLRRLCRSCNQRAAIEHFGLQKMHPYLKPH